MKNIYKEEFVVCSVSELVDIIISKINFDNLYDKPFPVLDFAVPDIDKNNISKLCGENIKTFVLDQSGWFGCRTIPESLFNTTDLILAFDYYGGGAFHTVTIIEDDEPWMITEAKKIMCATIINTLDYGGFHANRDTILAVHIHNEEWIDLE